MTRSIQSEQTLFYISNLRNSIEKMYYIYKSIQYICILEYKFWQTSEIDVANW